MRKFYLILLGLLFILGSAALCEGEDDLLDGTVWYTTLESNGLSFYEELSFSGGSWQLEEYLQGEDVPTNVNEGEYWPILSNSRYNGSILISGRTFPISFDISGGWTTLIMNLPNGNEIPFTRMDGWEEPEPYASDTLHGVWYCYYVQGNQSAYALMCFEDQHVHYTIALEGQVYTMECEWELYGDVLTLWYGDEYFDMAFDWAHISYTIEGETLVFTKAQGV